MRRLRYNVAVSLDGYIAGPNGEYDWITMDPSIDFSSIFNEFDTLVMGRNTYEVVHAQGPGGPVEGMSVVVISKTLDASDYPDVTIVGHDVVKAVAALKETTGKDLWLFGGGVLFRHLLEARLVDTIEVAVMPILLSRGIPLISAGERSPRLRLESSRVLPSGIVMLTYSVWDGSPKS